MRSLPHIASFWFGSDLSWLEALCIQSYLDHGHSFTLYAAHDIANIPPGVDLRHASEILWPAPFKLRPEDRLGVAVFSDIFRLKLLERTEFIWVDLDALCLQSFDFASSFVFAPSQSGKFPNGVLRLPHESQTLSQMLAFVTSANPTQPWRGAKLRRRNEQRIAAGEAWGIEALPWGCSGPKALGHFLRETGEDIHAMPADTFYPLANEALWKLHDPRIPLNAMERDGVHSVHVFGHQKKFMAQQTAGLPVRGSFLSTLCARHGIDPQDNPIAPMAWMGL